MRSTRFAVSSSHKNSGVSAFRFFSRFGLYLRTSAQSAPSSSFLRTFLPKNVRFLFAFFFKEKLSNVCGCLGVHRDQSQTFLERDSYRNEEPKREANKGGTENLDVSVGAFFVREFLALVPGEQRIVKGKIKSRTEFRRKTSITVKKII